MSFMVLRNGSYVDAIEQSAKWEEASGCGLTPQLRLFELTGLMRIIPVCASVDDAISSLRGGVQVPILNNVKIIFQAQPENVGSQESQLP